MKSLSKNICGRQSRAYWTKPCVCSQGEWTSVWQPSLTARLHTESEASLKIHSLCIIHDEPMGKKPPRCISVQGVLYSSLWDKKKPTTICLLLRICTENFIFLGSPEDIHLCHGFPGDSTAEEYNAISSLKSRDDPYLSHPYKQEKQMQNHKVCVHAMWGPDPKHELSVLCRANEDLKTQWIAANHKIETVKLSIYWR